MGRLKITQEEIDNIIKDYTIEWMGIRPIANKYHHSETSIRKILVSNNIQLRTHEQSHKQIYTIDDNFFDLNNQSYEMAYVLGMIAADGTVSSKNNEIRIELKSIDIEILQKIKILIKTDREIKIYQRKDKKLETALLYFFSKKIKDDLKKYNIVPKKTYNENFLFPDKLLKQYIPAFIRGYFDGNGCITTLNKKYNTNKWQLDCPSENVIDNIIVFLSSMGIETKKTISKQINIPLYRCYIYKKADIKKIYNLFYLNPNEQNPIYLERKYKKFSKLIMK